MDVLKGVCLGDRVEIEYRKHFPVEVSGMLGYVKSLDENELVLSTYDITKPKPSQYDILTYQVKDILSCTIWERED